MIFFKVGNFKTNAASHETERKKYVTKQLKLFGCINRCGSNWNAFTTLNLIFSKLKLLVLKRRACKRWSLEKFASDHIQLVFGQNRCQKNSLTKQFCPAWNMKLLFRLSKLMYTCTQLNSLSRLFQCWLWQSREGECCKQTARLFQSLLSTVPGQPF